MSVALTVGPERRTTPRRGPCPGTVRGSRSEPGGETSLERVVSGAWEGLATRSVVTCPVCAGVMLPRAHAEARIGGCCQGCGTELG